MVSVVLGIGSILLYFLFVFWGASLTNNEFNAWYIKTLGVVLAFTGLFFGLGGAYYLGASSFHVLFPDLANFYLNILPNA